MKKLLLFLFIGVTANVAQAQQELNLEDAVMQQYGKYYPTNTAAVQWIPGTQNFSFLSADYQTLLKGNAKNDKTSTIITTAELTTMTGREPRYVKVVEWIDENSFYTTIGEQYFLIKLKEKTSEIVASFPNSAEVKDFTSASGSLAYTQENKLFVASLSFPIANTDNDVVSGQAIARSEFGITKGTFWSNSGQILAYYQKDEKYVANYPLLNIDTPTGSLKSIKYPMAGQGSEKPAVVLFDVGANLVVTVKPSGKKDDYLTNFGWGPKDEHFYIAEVNRGQNHMKLNKYNTKTGALEKTLFEEKSDKWVEPEHPVYFVNDNQFIWMSERDGFMNLYLYDDEGNLVRQLTKNKWVTQEILGHDEAGNVYFQGTGENSMERHSYKVSLKSGKQTQLTEGAGTHNVSFSSDYSLMYDQMSSNYIPNKESIYDLSKGKLLRDVLVAADPYKDVVMGKAEIGTIKAADGKTDLNYRLIKPSNFDPKKKYPVLVYVYGGPHAQLITNSWLGGASLWMYWMAEQGYLVYTLDNRGSANRGFEFESIIHRQLGTVEMADQMEGVKHLKSLPYVNPNRLAVHGWSFGGFMTTSLMLREAGVFNVGVAGGPVTDWSYYEVMYGERYMDTPKENEAGYKANNLKNHVAKLKGDLLLIHGTMDDVVVMQHNLSLVQAFIEEGIQMDFFPYPMHKHNVRGKDRVHLMRKVLDYVIENNK
ncbi:MAG: prolyl oligopeptidase family serine peptidase [Crocinitomix sp.]|nr:prolyl oligopeptidase family serine peptidase [Crocinitomix sp.]